MLNVFHRRPTRSSQQNGEARFDYKFDQICSPLQDCQMKEVPLTGYENCVELMVQILYAE